MKVLGLTPGKNAPSARFRIRQYAGELQQRQITLNEYHAPIGYDYRLPGFLGQVKQRYIFPLSGALMAARMASRLPQIVSSRSHDLVWLNRPLVDGVFMEWLLKKPLVFDVDDAIWLNGRRQVEKIARQAGTVFAGNNFLAEWFAQYNHDVQVIHTAIDTSIFKPAKDPGSDFFKIVWTGSHQTAHYLLSIEQALAGFLNKYPKARLLVVSDQQPAFKYIKAAQLIFQKWNAQSEVSALQQAQVGIMPLFEGEWEKGKCSFKMLQYMAVGLPVIVSPVGMNAEVLQKGEIGFAAVNEAGWLRALEDLYHDRSLCEKLGGNAERVVAAHYSVKIISEKISGKFNDLIQRKIFTDV